MTTAPGIPTVHPRDHSARFWRGSLGAMASRGETDGPRVAEARAALRYWRIHAALTVDMTAQQAHDLMALAWPLAEQADTDTDAEPAEAVAR